MSTAVWGPPIWTLFHTMANKVSETKFPLIKNALFSYIKSICSNLPCPTCSAHAKTFLSQINFSKINDKSTFQHFLFTFHNVVNKRKEKPVFDVELLSNYSKVNLLSAFNNFAAVYKTKGNMKLLADSFHRTQVLTSFRKWFQANASSFSI